MDLAKSSFGGLDILANNAGLFLGRDFSDVSLDDWNRLASVNMTGVWLGTKIAPMPLRKGRIQPTRECYNQYCVNSRISRFRTRPFIFDDQGRRNTIHEIHST